MRLELKLGKKLIYLHTGFIDQSQPVAKSGRESKYTWSELDALHKAGLSWRKIGKLFSVSGQAVHSYWRTHNPHR